MCLMIFGVSLDLYTSNVGISLPFLDGLRRKYCAISEYFAVPEKERLGVCANCDR